MARLLLWDLSIGHAMHSYRPPISAPTRGEIQPASVVDDNMKPLAQRSGPVGELQRIFEEVRALPRWQQRKIIDDRRRSRRAVQTKGWIARRIHSVALAELSLAKRL